MPRKIENISPEIFKKDLLACLEKLQRRDGELFNAKGSVAERAIAHRLAVYLERKYSDFHVDCEYNKHGYGLKCPSLSKYKKHSVMPDICIHSRREDGYNLAVFEIKKFDTTKEKYSRDKEKIHCYINELGYKFGSLLVFDTSGSIVKDGRRPSFLLCKDRAISLE